VASRFGGGPQHARTLSVRRGQTRLRDRREQRDPVDGFVALKRGIHGVRSAWRPP
jgi:hypothetical protein